MPMRRIGLLSLMIIGVLLMAVPLFAQTTAQPIAYGDTVNGQLTTDALAQRFTFTAREGDVVTIALDSVNNDFDAVLRLLNADGQQVAFNDDRRGSRNSEIAAYTIGRAGEYTIVASSLNGRQTGAFTLTLREGAPPTPTALPTSTPFPTTVPTQLAPATSIAYGDTVTGELTDIAPSVLYTFSGSQGDGVRVTMDGNRGIDTTLRILNPTGQEVAYNDDSRGSLSSQIELFVLPADGTYTIVAGGFANSARGTYSLLLEQVEVPESVGAQTIEIGQTVNGELTQSDLAINYTFSATEGDVVTITLDAVDNRFDAFLRLLAADGSTLITNDDSRGSLNSQIAGFVLPASGEYTIVATSLSGRQTGAFVLSLEEGVPVMMMTPTPTPFTFFPTPVPSVTSDGGMIEYGQTVTGELTEAALTRSYTFTGGAGDTVLITLDAVNNGFDTTLTLNDSFGSQIAYNDDSRGSLNSQIGPFVLPSSGEYTVLVNSYSGNATGAFTLTLRVVSSQPISYNEPVTLSFDEFNREYFLTFSATNGDLIDIFVDSSRTNPIDTALNLLDPAGYTAISDEDSGSGSNPEINGYLIYNTGTYTIQLFAQDTVRDAAGDVTVTLMRRVPPSLDEGAQTLRFSSSVQQQSLAFSGVGGERVRLVLTQEGGTPSSSLGASVRQGDNEVTSLSSYNATSASFEFIVPVDGDLSVIVSEYSYTNVTITVTLERLGR